jgi:hypothetical protein
LKVRTAHYAELFAVPVLLCFVSIHAIDQALRFILDL